MVETSEWATRPSPFAETIVMLRVGTNIENEIPCGKPPSFVSTLKTGKNLATAIHRQKEFPGPVHLLHSTDHSFINQFGSMLYCLIRETAKNCEKRPCCRFAYPTRRLGLQPVTGISWRTLIAQPEPERDSLEQEQWRSGMEQPRASGQLCIGSADAAPGSDVGHFSGRFDHTLCRVATGIIVSQYNQKQTEIHSQRCTFHQRQQNIYFERAFTL